MKKWTSLCFLCLVLTSAPLLADVVVIIGAKATTSTLDKQVLSDIFLGKSATLPNGEAVVPVEQKEDSPLREEFHTKVTNKSSNQLRAYWSKQIFSGKGKPPKEVADSAAVKQLVVTNPNTIGYIDKAAVDDSVKVLLAP
ncbi:Phosphate ABC transporter substrate-binding protein [Gammaproteobacteria bacterium]